MKPTKSILVATDFSDVSDHAVAYAVALARQLDARVTVVHAYEIPVYGVPDGALIASAEIAAKIHTAAKTALEATVNSIDTKGVPIVCELRAGEPAGEVTRLVDELGSDLVVVGTHGRRGLTRALLGSVAEAIIRTSPVPVLAVRAPEAS